MINQNKVIVKDGEFMNVLEKFKNLESGEKKVEETNRITSYNVCYTKLLRVLLVVR